MTGTWDVKHDGEFVGQWELQEDNGKISGTFYAGSPAWVDDKVIELTGEIKDGKADFGGYDVWWTGTLNSNKSIFHGKATIVNLYDEVCIAEKKQ